jgi:hypothetical protein
MNKIQICQNSVLWDSRLSSSSGGWISNTTQWRDCLEQSFPQMKCIPLLIGNDSEAPTQIALYKISSMIKGTRYVNSPYSSISSIVCDSPGHISELIGYFDSLRKDHGQKIRIEMYSSKKHELLEQCGRFQLTRNYMHHFLDLQKDSSKIFDSFHLDCVKRSIKKSEKSKFKLRRADQLSDVNDFYRLYCITRKNLGLPPMPLVFFQKLFTNLFPRGELDIYFTLLDNKSVAGLLLLKYKDTVLVEFAGDDFSHRKLFPNHFVYWNCIQLAQKQGYKRFSFGRTHKLNMGLLQFKRRWGTQEEYMSIYSYPKESACDSTKEDTMAYRLVNKIAPKMPMPLFRLMGTILYRYAG